MAFFYSSHADEGVQVISDAIAAGYQHFDGALFMEVQLGQALRKVVPLRILHYKQSLERCSEGQPRHRFEKSVEKSLSDVDYGIILMPFLVHWPVPGCFVSSVEGNTRRNDEAIGLSNF
jgi:diketogulonate reductase-like aldo/keto reductase